MLPIWQFALTAFVAMSVGVVLAFIGGVGVNKHLILRCDTLEGELADLSERITRMQKRLAGVAAADARAEKRTDAELQKEAAELLAKAPATPKLPLGFPSVFNRG